MLTHLHFNAMASSSTGRKHFFRTEYNLTWFRRKNIYKSLDLLVPGTVLSNVHESAQIIPTNM